MTVSEGFPDNTSAGATVAPRARRNWRKPAEAAPAPIKEPVGMPGKAGYTKIILDPHEDIPPTGQLVGVNGTMYLIRAGEAVNVPNGVLEVLDNAIMAFPIIDPATRKVVGHTDRQRLTYRRVA